MTERTNAHSTPTVLAGVFEPLNPLEPGYSDPDAAEFTQPVAPTAQLFFSLFQAARIFGKSPARCASGPIRAVSARSKLAALVSSLNQKSNASYVAMGTKTDEQEL